MFHYLKTLYRSMQVASYYDHVARTTSKERLRDEINMLMAINS